MTLTTLANACSHLQNASRARLGLTSIPSSNGNLRLALALHYAGFISSVTRGGPQPPLSLISPTSLPTATDPASLDPLDPDSAHVTQANVATRRLWLGMKYYNDEPVLERCWMISKPKQKLWLQSKDIEQVLRGRMVKYVKGLTRTGECIFISTDMGLLEGRECVDRGIGGMAICRAY